jgi:hypothetical protein
MINKINHNAPTKLVKQNSKPLKVELKNGQKTKINDKEQKVQGQNTQATKLITAPPTLTQGLV